MFKKMWAAANFSEGGGGGGGGAEDDDVRGKRNAAVVARQKFEAEPPAKLGAKKVHALPGLIACSSAFLHTQCRFYFRAIFMSALYLTRPFMRIARCPCYHKIVHTVNSAPLHLGRARRGHVWRSTAQGSARL